jgi:hypothetical protein
MSEEVYDFLVKEMGYSSLDDAEKGRGGETPDFSSKKLT